MSAPPFKVKAVYEYASPHEDDLPFPEGQIITVIALEDADWYEGEYTDASGNKHKGLFPKNFVERYEPEIPSRPARRPQSEIRSPPPQPPVPEPAPGAFPEEAEEDDDDDSFAEPPPVPAQSKSVVEPEAAPAPLPPRDLSPPAARQTAPPPPPAQETVRSPPPQAEPAVVRETIKSPPPAPKPAPSEPVKSEPVKADPPKKEPPPVSSKPSSFRDRIAAFNNAGAAPVAPFKPAAPTFVKKPFVAPPPSKNAYIPPPKAEPVQKIYRREEDPDIQKEQAQADENAAKAGLLPSDHPQSPTGEEDEDQPKPQSLKERIAMLQKQQMEQAARRADVSDKPKPKKPVKKHTDESAESAVAAAAAAAPPPIPQAHVPAAEEEEDDDAEHPERHVRQSLDQPRDRERTRGASARGVSREPALPTAGNEMLSDSNDADMSGAGDITEENDVDSDSTQPARKSMQSQRAPAAPVQEADVGEQQDTTEDDESEEDEMDAETRRRMELRERMAKMSGGMGMAGMFGAPAGMPGMMAPAPAKPKKTKEPKPEHDEAAASAPAPAPAQAPRVPVIPIPGMQTARSPEVEDRQLAVEKEPEHDTSITSEREPLDVPDVEDVKPQPPPHIEPVHRVPPIPQDRPLASPTSERAHPPPVPGARPVPAPPVPESRPVPPPPPPVDTQMDPTEGEESDDERSLAPTRQSTDMSRGVPPPVPRPEATRSPSMGSTKRASTFGSLDAMSPTSPATPASEKRQSRIPPIPGTLSTPPQARAPPPPPPTGAPQLPPIIPSAPLGEPDEGESEYEGDYDTDIASSVNHKDALKAHARDSSLEEPDVPAPAPAPRAVPPPPPTQPPPTRASIDAPRMAPPPVPVHAPAQPEQYEDEEDDYQEPPRALPIRAVPPPPPTAPAPVPVQQEYAGDSSDDLYDAPPPRQSIDRPPPPPPVDQDRAAPLPPSQPPQIARTGTHQSRQSLDVSRPSMNMRRSMDVGRPPQDGHIATDVDLAESSLWWANPNTPPPVFQNRSDILFEVEENVTQRRGGRTAITKDVYVLFIDYSQTVITARYDGQNPQEVSFEQRHEPPPPRLRQDQLETAWQKYGARMSEAAAAKKDQVVGDGSPNALVLDLLKPFTDALRPVGTRAYGALVYANLANASVQQFDEIRAGDIITLRNAKLQGKHGAMHKSYAMDVSSHVGVVVDWDGTKKKVRAWEQGREKAKTRMESFRLGDLRSGEVRVWRVVGREWVGWDS